MKLQNKKTGEKVILQNRDDLRVLEDYDIYINIYDGSVDLLYKEDGDEYKKHYHYSTFEMFRLKWKEYEEPKDAWYISIDGSIVKNRKVICEFDYGLKSIGNYFETEEEAEKAVEKLKAWKRLKDKGFRFTGFSGGSTFIEFTFDKPTEPGSAYKDLDLLFGGEE